MADIYSEISGFDFEAIMSAVPDNAGAAPDNAPEADSEDADVAEDREDRDDYDEGAFYGDEDPALENDPEDGEEGRGTERGEEKEAFAVPSKEDGARAGAKERGTSADAGARRPSQKRGRPRTSDADRGADRGKGERVRGLTAAALDFACARYPGLKKGDAVTACIAELSDDPWALLEGMAGDDALDLVLAMKERRARAVEERAEKGQLAALAASMRRVERMSAYVAAATADPALAGAGLERAFASRASEEAAREAESRAKEAVKRERDLEYRAIERARKERRKKGAAS